MKKITPMLAISLGACVTDPNAQTAVDAQTKIDLQNYVADNWYYVQQALRRTSTLPAGNLEFVEIGDIRCDPVGGALSCNYLVTAKSDSGQLVAVRDWGTYAYHEGSFGEVIIVG